MVFQHDRPRPIPLVHEVKEFGENGRTTGHGIELADASDHNSPSNSSRITKDRTVYAATYVFVSYETVYRVQDTHGSPRA